MLKRLTAALAAAVFALCVSTAALASGKTLVIDAGHGGADGGAATAGGVCESEINLAISQRLQALAGLLGVETVMTRESADIDYPPEADTISSKKVYDQKSRVSLINSTENAVLVSVHQNKYPDTGPSGPQVLYAKTQGSAEFGELMHANLTQYLCPENRRVAAPISDEIYLMRSVECPAVLVESGFLSNPREAELLLTPHYQTKLAIVMLASFLQFYP